MAAQVRYDPDATGPRHMLAAVEGVGFTAEPYAEQRLGEARWVAAARMAAPSCSGCSIRGGTKGMACFLLDQVF